MTSYAFAVLATLAQERAALEHLLRERLTSVIRDPALGDVWSLSIDSSEKPGSILRGLLVSLGGVGRVDSALATISTLRTWRPRYVVLVGVAGGFRAQGVRLGDVIVSTEIVDYNLGKIRSEDIELRPRRTVPSARMLKAARSVAAGARYQSAQDRSSSAPAVHFGPVASGDFVVASGGFVERLLRAERRLLGVEMEAAGVIAAIAHQRSQVELLVVRGIADLSDESKSDDHMAEACSSAAQFAVEMLRKLPPVDSSDHDQE